MLIDQVIAFFHVTQAFGSRGILGLRRGSVQIDPLHGLQQLFLGIQQLQLAGGNRVFRLVIGRLILTVTEDRDADRQSDTLVETIPDLATESVIRSGKMAGTQPGVHGERRKESTFRLFLLQLGDVHGQLTALYLRHHGQRGIVNRLLARKRG